MKNRLHEYDVVALLHTFEDVNPGSLGVVLMVHEGGEAYEVEFPGTVTKRLTYTVPSGYLAQNEPSGT
jgi:Domain of unknown function (DUF4926)